LYTIPILKLKKYQNNIPYYSCTLHQLLSIKGIGYILFLKNGLKKKLKKNYKNNFRSNNYEVCTALVCCFQNILGVVVPKNINLSSDRIGRLPLWFNEKYLNFCHQSAIYTVRSVYFNRTLIAYVHGLSSVKSQ
jgi:hypothetical protein